MKVLVTGAAGYIGSVLCHALLEEEYDVIALDDFRYGQYTALAACCGYRNFEVVKGDARRANTILSLVNRADVIIPLAALVGAPLCQMYPNEAEETNMQAVATIAEIASKEALIIYPNTNSAYGHMSPGETAPLTEDAVMKPLTVYAKTKLEAEGLLFYYHPDNSVVFRLATVFGASPRMRTDLLVNDFVRRALFDKSLVVYQPEARRNYIHIRDVASAFIWAIEQWCNTAGVLPANNNVFNLGHDGSNCTKWELAQRIRQHIPDFIPQTGAGEDPDKRDYIISNERLRKAGFAPWCGLDYGINELIKLYTGFPAHHFGNV